MRRLAARSAVNTDLVGFEVLDRFKDRTRLLLKPVTGRSHQLRIHMRELGHPILGCDMYAHPEALAMAPRLMLHAWKVAFDHPIGGQRIEVEAPVPPVFDQVAKALG